jgi:hypothetical protein
MSSPRSKAPIFISGQTVTVIRNKRFAKAGGDFAVGRQLPELNGVRQYLIRSIADGHQRVVTEHEIV